MKNIDSLFDVGAVYVIDTCSLINLARKFSHTPTFDAVWQEIDDLMKINCFRTLHYVEIELNSYGRENDFLKEWVAKRKKHFVFQTSEECYIEAIPIINEEYNTGFFDAKKKAEGKEEADPYLIAYCKMNNFTLISDENPLKPNKIPQVSKKNGVKCIDIYDFFRERGLKMERKK